MTDTIVAPVTAFGRAGVGIVRLSGSKVPAITRKLLGKLPPPRLATYSNFTEENNEIIDKGLALFFPAPHSFTGEDILELQVHGSPIVMECLIRRLLEFDIRLARPGEFSERAFLNGKMDLTQAEAIADLINAGSLQAARAAIHSLEGVFSQKIRGLTEKLIRLRMYVEASLDFAEEEIDFLSEGNILEKVEVILHHLEDILKQAKQGALLQAGMTVVIAGKPNAGKSSLLNQLSGRESAIVTHIPGTTRDVLRENIHIDGLPLQVIDTAGLRESDDPIEQEGIKRAKEMIEKADRVLYLKDVTDEKNEEDDPLLHHPRVTVVYNKVDLQKSPPKLPFPKGGIFISAKTGEGIDQLKNHLKECMGFQEDSEAGFSARRRHLDALRRAKEFLLSAKEKLISKQNAECVAEELRLALQALCEITGEFTTEDLLSRIFSNFCIGK